MGDRAFESSLRRKYVGQALKQWRENAGYSQTDVAATLKYGSAQFISNWERGLALPPLDALPKLVSLFRVSPEEMANVIYKYQERLLAHQHSELKKLLKKGS